MKLRVLVLSAGLLTGSAALAAGGVFGEADANQDGALTMDEVQLAMPLTTPEAFTAADADGDGALSQAEFAEAMQSGLLRVGG